MAIPMSCCVIGMPRLSPTTKNSFGPSVTAGNCHGARCSTYRSSIGKPSMVSTPLCRSPHDPPGAPEPLDIDGGSPGMLDRHDFTAVREAEAKRLAVDENQIAFVNGWQHADADAANRQQHEAEREVREHDQRACANRSPPRDARPPTTGAGSLVVHRAPEHSADTGRHPRG